MGGPGWGDGARLPGRPGSGLLDTRRKGFGGGKNVGGKGGASELRELSDGVIVLVQSLALLNDWVWFLFAVYNCANFLITQLVSNVLELYVRQLFTLV